MRINNMMNIYIFGAHSRATTMGYYLSYLNPDIKILSYLYDNDEENPSDIDGVPVVKVNNETVLDTSCTVYIGTRGIHHSAIIETLRSIGMKSIVPVDFKLDLDTRKKFLEKYYASMGRKFGLIDCSEVTDKQVVTDTAKIYVASSVYDKPLKKAYELAGYEKKIQVGAALTDIVLDDSVYDNTGDNISDKNPQFCELTGLYWIWKNATEDIVGLCHYRRHFILPDDWKDRMLSNKIDVILPTPLYVSPSLDGNYRFRHEAYVLDCMYDDVKARYPEEYYDVRKFFRENGLYSPCNMFIMRREVLVDLCSWMFPILLSVSDKVGILDDKYQNRYPGFLSERLITYFFEKNSDKYKVIYADKNFLE